MSVATPLVLGEVDQARFGVVDAVEFGAGWVGVAGPAWVPQLTFDLVHDRGCWCRSARWDLAQHRELPSNTT